MMKPHELTEDEETIVTAGNRVGRRVPDLVVRGMHEREILGFAPARLCDRLHWVTSERFDMAGLIAHLGPKAWSRQWSDGQQRIWVPAGLGAVTRQRVRDWCAVAGTEAINLRIEAEVPFRDLDSMPDGLLAELIAACVDWLYPRTHSIRRKLVRDLELIEDEDVYSLMYLFVHDLADRYDADRPGRNGALNFTAFMYGKLRTWPQDAARNAYGRTVVSDRIALRRVDDAAIRESGRLASESEQSAALGVSVIELRRRREAIAVLDGMRHHRHLVSTDPLPDDFDAVVVVSDEDVAEQAVAFAQDAEITRALLAAVNHDDPRRPQDPLGLAAVYLTFWKGLGRTDVARELGVLPKTVTAAVGRTLDRMSIG